MYLFSVVIPIIQQVPPKIPAAIVASNTSHTCNLSILSIVIYKREDVGWALAQRARFACFMALVGHSNTGPG